MANQYTAAGTSQRQRILTYVEDNPGCTTHEIREEVDVSLSNINMYLARLRNAGQVRPEKMPGDRALKWHPVEEYERPRQVPNMCGTRDPMVAALFGIK